MAAIAVPKNHLFPPGPCEIAVGTGGTSRAMGSDAAGGVQGHGLPGIEYEFLGTTRDGGRAQEVLYTGNISTDYSGSFGMPADVCLSGKGIVVVCQVHNFNPFVMNRLKSRYWGGVLGLSRPGFIDIDDMGALLIHEGRYIPVCIRSLNAYSSDVFTIPKYPNNEAGLWIPMAFCGGDLGWDYAAREQIYTLTFIGITYVNDKLTIDGPDPHFLGMTYNRGALYSINDVDIRRIWNDVANPSS